MRARRHDRRMALLLALVAAATAGAAHAADCNSNGQDDAQDIAIGTSLDCDGNGIPDECDVEVGFFGHAVDAQKTIRLHPADLDGDGDLDVAAIVGPMIAVGDLVWYENVDGNGTFGTARPVGTDATSVNATDVDGDGDLDILSASTTEVRWFENLDGQGTFGAVRIVFAGADGADSAVGGDLDGDGDTDLLSTFSSDDELVWFENLDGLGAFGPRRIISTAYGNPIPPVLGDFDADGRLDVLSGARLPGTVAWFRNLGDGLFDPGDSINGSIALAEAVFAADLDGDGDLDAMSGSADGKIAWYENLDGAGSFGILRLVGLRDTIIDVHAADIDGDGDQDTLAADRYDGFFWYENLDGEGVFSGFRPIPIGSGFSTDLGAADIDGDGNIDVLTANLIGGWAENLSQDCNGNAIPDACDLSSGAAQDCNADTVPDACEIAVGNAGDCNQTGIPDACDIASGDSDDCDLDGQPDECQVDCNGNGLPDSCDVDGGGSADCTSDGVPDECEPDCNLNGNADSCDIDSGASLDCDGDGVPDDCQDCNGNGIGDTCDITAGTSLDCDLNGLPDECDAANGADCDGNGVPDTCDTAEVFLRHSVSTEAAGASAIVLADVDGDGDRDIVSASADDGKIAWYSNLDGRGTFGPQQVIADLLSLVFTVSAGDLDLDGDTDIVAGKLGSSGKLIWIPNEGGGAFGTSITIAPGSTYQARVVDLDRDGDPDVLAAMGDQLALYDNTDGAATFAEDIIHEPTPSLLWTSAFADDLDGDGDLDVLATQFRWLAWHRNNGNGGWSTFGLTGEIDSGNSAYIADVDLDGDNDALCATYSDGKLIWHRNLDGTTGFSPEHLIGFASGPRAMLADDLDGDGDPDVVAALEDEGSIVWHENVPGLPEFSTARVIDANVPGASAVVLGDVNADGLVDVVAASADAGEILWYERVPGDCNGNDLPDSCDVTSGLATDCDMDGVLDLCQEATGVIGDCNDNGVVDVCDISSGTSGDCDLDSLPDECEDDCNANLVPDGCDVTSGTSDDCNANFIPDECEQDCNGNALPDECDLASGASSDCNANGFLDECDLAAGSSEDCGGDGVPDECQIECNGQGVIDPCLFTPDPPPDCDDDGILDLCEISFEFVANEISTLATVARGVATGDLDGDGDDDVLSAAWVAPNIAWYENVDGVGQFGSQAPISSSSPGATSVFIADLDGDGYLDALASSAQQDEIVWHRNLDGNGFGTERLISFFADFARSVVAADLDGDGDMDVVSGSQNDDKVAWYENVDGLGNFGAEQVITTGADAVWSVWVADIDADGDGDVLSASHQDDRVAWYENIDGAGTFGPQRTITTDADGAVSVHAADLDGDGDVDVLSASELDDRIAWYENLDGDGTFGPLQVISTEGQMPRTVRAVDLDGDGDPDVLAASELDNEIAMYRNVDGRGTFGLRKLISTNAQGPYSLAPSDVDGDGNVDFVSVSAGDGKVVWYRNETDDCNGNLVLDTCEADCNANGLPDACDLAAARSIDCNGNLVPDECDTGCVGDCDQDGDLCHDALDASPTDPSVCADVDGDGCDDCASGVFAPLTDGPDTDLDGVCDATDCSSADGLVWSEPGPAQAVLAGDDAGTTVFTWLPPLDPGAGQPSYDVLRSPASSDFNGAAVCLATDTDTAIALDAATPAPGELWSYLVRSRNDCPGDGSLGSDSTGTPRSGRTCP